MDCGTWREMRMAEGGLQVEELRRLLDLLVQLLGQIAAAIGAAMSIKYTKVEDLRISACPSCALPFPVGRRIRPMVSCFLILLLPFPSLCFSIGDQGTILWCP